MIDIKKLNETMAKELDVKNVHTLPVIEKVVLNVGVGDAENDKARLEEARSTLSIISGQTPVNTTAKKSIAGFKVRENSIVGTKVTLRGKRMYSFLERLLKVTLPRIRDFRGVNPDGIDKQGNFTMALPEQNIFPEIPYEKIKTSHGLSISLRIKNTDKAKSRKLIETLGFPFKKKEVK